MANNEQIPETTMEAIRSAMKDVRVPTAHSRVCNDECAFSFDTPEAVNGLYTNLNTWQSFSHQYVKLDHERTGNKLYLHQKWKRIPKEKKDDNTEEVKPTKLAIGVPGGFETGGEQYDIMKENSVVVMPEGSRVPFPSLGLPSVVTLCVEAILEHKGFAKSQAIAAYEEVDERKESKYARNLAQLDIGKKISPDPKTWKCDETGVTENLWLNLSTGFIGSGRRNWDGSGGNGAAMRHFEATGKKYPLCVKLGTITPHGADVFSYADDENDMVIDPLLKEHLAHWGINMEEQKQTEKTLMEMQIDLNLSHEWNTITESGASLTPVSGPGCIGMTNLGSSCYMNSLFQLLASLPAFKESYLGQRASIFYSAPELPMDDSVTMIAKLFDGLLTDRYTKREEEEGSDNTTNDVLATGHVKPAMLKAAIAKKHPEFSSGRQQDIVEYYQYVLDVVGKAEKSACKERIYLSSPSNADQGSAQTSNGGVSSNDVQKKNQVKKHLPFSHFQFLVEDRLQCKQSEQVRYSSSMENIVELPIPVERGVRRESAAEGSATSSEVHNVKITKQPRMEVDSDIHKELQQVSFDDCLKSYFDTQSIEGFLSPATGKKGVAEKRIRFQTFPEYLVVSLRRYYMADDWSVKKLEVRVEVPEELDLTQWQATGKQEGEVVFSEEDAAAPSQAENGANGVTQNADDSIVQQIIAMGFSENAAKRAAANTENQGIEAAMQWVFSHSDDADFNEPLPSKSSNVSKQDTQMVDEGTVGTLESMGFPRPHAVAALKSSKGDVAAATEWLFSNAGNMEEVLKQEQEKENELANSSDGGDEATTDGIGKYNLLGFASHMGKNTSCGHYVAHIKKDGRFLLFNDEKVALSQTPPKDLGYFYVYRRADVSRNKG